MRRSAHAQALPHSPDLPRGEHIAQLVCSVCHVVGKDQRFPPLLNNHHLKHRLSNPHTTVLIIGFQVAGSLGRSLVDGARTVRLFDDDVAVNARIVTLGGFSAHADQSALLGWLAHFQRAPKDVFLVHGEPRACDALATRIKSELGWEVCIPVDGARANL